MLLARREQFDVRIETDRLGRPLRRQMVGNDDQGLMTKTQPFQLHSRRDHRIRFSGSNAVRKEGGLVGQYPPDRMALMRVERDLCVNPRQQEMAAVALAFAE